MITIETKLRILFNNSIIDKETDSQALKHVKKIDMLVSKSEPSYIRLDIAFIKGGQFTHYLYTDDLMMDVTECAKKIIHKFGDQDDMSLLPSANCKYYKVWINLKHRIVI